MEMLREMGFCNGIENYSRILDGRKPGDRPVLPDRLLPRRLRLLPRRVPPDRAADRRDVRGRPQPQETLVDYGFRLPSALDNRPQTFDEFLVDHAADRVRLGDARARSSARARRAIVEQIVRPTGIVDPAVEVRETQARSTT